MNYPKDAPKARSKVREAAPAMERLELRLSPDLKDEIERAATIRGVTVATFLRECASTEAHRIIQEETFTTLERKDWNRFVSLLAETPRPTAALIDLMRGSPSDGF